MTRPQLLAMPIPGRWSTLEAICHLADSEALFADRMKRILAEDQPLLAFADPKLFGPALVYSQRDAEMEIDLLELIRKQMATILRAVPPESFSRTGIHSRDGVCTLGQVLTKAVTHLQHHLKFIVEKRLALQASAE